MHAGFEAPQVLLSTWLFGGSSHVVKLASPCLQVVGGEGTRNLESRGATGAAMSGTSGGSSHAPSRCLYMALNVPRDATAAVIKKAYRMQALVWHPDKNVGNEAEAQIRFQELQHAYAVLSDSHERKWYDDHRDEILNPARYSGDGDSDDGAGGRTVNLTPFFSATAFSGFGDDEAGFYQTYDRAFRKVWESERDWGEMPSKGAAGWGQGDAPSLGSSTDSHETADNFYAKWSGFVSGLSFGWVDDYNLNEAENRRVRRLMEKENNKRRAIAKRKYQDDVRALVDFCRRRDRRVIRHKLKLAEEKQERDRRRHADASSRKEDMKRRKEEWARARQVEEDAEEEARARAGEGKSFRLDEEDDDDDESSGPEEAGRKKKKAGKRRGGKGGKAEEEVTVFVCAVCKKNFKSKGQVANHETSKAHKKKLKELDAEMLREAISSVAEQGDELDEDDEAGSSAQEESDPDGDEASPDEQEGEDADFFMDSAMRDLDLDAGLKNAEESDRSGDDDSDAEDLAGGNNKRRGPPDAEPAKTSRGLFDFGSSSDSDSGKDSSDSGSGSEGDSSGSGSGSTDSGSSGGGGGLDDEEDPNMFETIATASAVASQIDPSGDMRTAAAVAASAAAVAAANSAAGKFNLSGDFGSAVSAATSAGLSWWKNHNAEAPGVLSRTGASDSGDSAAQERDYCAGNAEGHQKERSKKAKHKERAKRTANSPRAERQERAGATRSSASSGGESDDSEESGPGEDFEPAGKRGRRKVTIHRTKAGSLLSGKEGRIGTDDVAPPAGTGARRRRRQAAKAVKAARGKGVASGDKRDEENELSCRVCATRFPSRSKLFAHVKAEGHALLK